MEHSPEAHRYLCLHALSYHY